MRPLRETWLCRIFESHAREVLLLRHINCASSVLARVVTETLHQLQYLHPLWTGRSISTLSPLFQACTSDHLVHSKRGLWFVEVRYEG
jgi:hypothetical protein